MEKNYTASVKVFGNDDGKLLHCLPCCVGFECTTNIYWNPTIKIRNIIWVHLPCVAQDTRWYRAVLVCKMLTSMLVSPAVSTELHLKQARLIQWWDRPEVCCICDYSLKDLLQVSEMFRLCMSAHETTSFFLWVAIISSLKVTLLCTYPNGYITFKY